MIQQSQKNNWQTKKLGKVCNIVMGQSPLSIAYNEDCVGLPLVQGNNDIKKGKTIERIYTSEITKTSEKGDIILTVRAPVGCIGIVHKKICIGRGVCSISTKKENQNFIFYFLKFFEPKWVSLEQGSTFTAVNSSDIRKLKIFLPPFPEQNRIVAILEIWDKYLEKLSRKIEIKKNIKKGLMQILLSGDVRLNGFSQKWKKVKLEELYNITSSKRVFQREWQTRGVPFYRAREIIKLSKNGYVDNDLFISEKMYDDYRDKYGVPKKNDLLVTGVGTIGIACRIKNNNKFYFKDGNIIWFKSKNLVSSEFVEQLFKMSIIINQILRNTPITTVATYTIDMAKKTIIYIPSIDEQTTIAKILTTADKEIETLEKKKKIIEEQKKFLLNSLVTGRIRV